ncbi:MAG: ATP-binding cassette domain-containing protein [Pseudomonadota bacterium]
MLFDPRHAKSHSVGLTLNGLVFRAGGRPLLDGLTAQMSAHAKTVVLGPNGAGKSLTLRAIQGLIDCDEGEVAFLRGETAAAPISALHKREGGVGIVFQKPVLFRRTVRANLIHALKAAGIDRSERDMRATILLRMAGLEPIAERSARVLSGGEQQKLSIVRALAASPSVLLLDEPTASLDPRATHDIENLIVKARSEGVKIVLVTHDLGQAKRLADEVLFIHQGRATELTVAADFFAKPRSPEARAYLDGELLL